MRILVAEDNPVNRMIAIKQLEKLGLTADTASNGTEALAALKAFPYGLVFMDCHMPEMDGYEAARRIRESSDERLRTVPIIAMTADAVPGNRERCLEAGMSDFISKPFKLEQLAALVQKWRQPTESLAG